MTTITTGVVAAREKQDTKGRRIAVRERREELLAEFDASGLTQRAFGLVSVRPTFNYPQICGRAHSRC